MKRFVLWSLSSVSILLILLTGIGVPIAPIPLILTVQLLFGWVGYLWRVVPQVQIAWGGVAVALACLAGVLFLGHRTARWLWRETRPSELRGVSRWRPAWTLAAAATVVLMFACGIAAVGVTHQAAWLVRSDESLFGYRSRESANRVKCSSNLRQIGYAIEVYARANHGRLPDSFAELLLSEDIAAEVFTCPATDLDRAPGKTAQEQVPHLPHHCSYVYHGRGLVQPIPADRPIACEPLPNHRGAGMNVLFADGTVEFIPAADARRIMARLDAPPATHPTTAPTTPAAAPAGAAQ
jgi:prepilin-type processing-associated H-X9-DG protein